MPKTELLIDAGNKCLWRHQATTENGMDTFFNHYFEMNPPPHITETPVRHPQGRYQASSRDLGVS